MKGLVAQGFGERLERALDYRASQKGRATRDEIGARIAYARRSGEQFGTSAFSMWISEKNDVGLRVVEALALECYVRPAWLAFADGEMGRRPPRPAPR